MFTFTEFNFAVENAETNPQNLDFLNLLSCKWDEVHEKCEVFRYKINNLQDKVVDGYLLQLNPERNCKRRTPEQIDNICQSFDGTKFNFNKVSPQEVLFTFKKDVQDSAVHSVIVNVSPISRYHSLLCPSLDKCLPQVVTEESLELVISLMLLVKDRAFRIGFNSLCGLASVNHLHYHIFMENNILPVETAKCNHLQGPVYCLNQDYPIPAFCFQIPCEDSATKSSNMAKDIYKLLEYLLHKSIAHNIFITRGESVDSSEKEVIRVLVWPRKSSAGVKQLSAFNVAVLELSGWFPVYNADDFENLQAADLEKELKKWRIDNFEDLCKEIKSLF
ncbi:GDP-D-glucose phosphorylase 1 [Ostrinia nubilalis]|uniref:GDP-D-glucose phosphorylase 1 n=1 Tax=Ostrinia nubilalis TaxID=29057 RepID=UPI0030824F9B